MRFTSMRVTTYHRVPAAFMREKPAGRGLLHRSRHRTSPVAEMRKESAPCT